MFRKRGRQVWPPVIGFCVFAYFAYHVVQGERGLLAWHEYGVRLAEGQATLDALTAERTAIERRTALLSARSLDPDLLEERARIMLNAVDPADRLVIVPDGPFAE